MFFFRGSSKKQKVEKSPFSPGIMRLAVVLFILYIITTDYTSRQSDVMVPPPEAAVTVLPEEASVTLEEVTPGEGAEALPGMNDFYKKMIAEEEITKPEIKLDPEVEITTLMTDKVEGPYAGFGDTVVVRYVGLLQDQTAFVDTREIPATFILGDGSIIPGLEQGISGMHEGEVRQVLVPPKLAFDHPDFHNDLVPAGAMVGFLVRMVDIQEGEGTLPERLTFRALDEKTGTGDAVKEGDKVSTRYVLYNAHGMVLKKENGPHNFVLGESNAPEDYTNAIVGMKPGGKRYILLPPEVLKNTQTDLPKYQLLHLELELVAAGDTVLLPEMLKQEVKIPQEAAETPAEPDAELPN